ncbi:hypothetical protein H6F76_23740 [Leptolyngbya sp. FACHB-321]|uniref:hypothetical protein n=1 Tax=Leptolyngbya sp. FACHB-321 TaxID=2692807 RepID=UPI001685A16B|nr:hypothetical protein [Leptolyngbya sp. FACHB-321]MBD2037966.1 hypothetical protein [Leptolyngbya sp. FACHB-321]
MLKKTEAGRTVASIAELANFQVKADTRTEALTVIQALVSNRLKNVELLPLAASLKQFD